MTKRIIGFFLLVLVLLYYTNHICIEKFEQCFFKRYVFQSSNANILISKSNYNYEIPLQDMRKLVKKYNIKSNFFLNQINNSIINRKESKFIIVKKKRNEYVIYRKNRAFGFHIQTNYKKRTKTRKEVNELIKIIGIMNEFDISYLDPSLIEN